MLFGPVSISGPDKKRGYSLLQNPSHVLQQKGGKLDQSLTLYITYPVTVP